MSGLGILWFVLIFVLIAGYFVLDGFDLGVGVLFPFLGKSEEQKQQMIRTVGPVWDGNEVWLLTAGGALFAAFAPAYATSFSGFYLAIMLVLFGLVLRAVAIEFAYSDHEWKKLWYGAFFAGSLLPALLFGVAVGNVIAGIPLDANGDYAGTFVALLNPFALVCGLVGLVLMLVQACSWLGKKMPLESEVRAKAIKLRKVFAVAEIALFAVASVLFFAVVVPASAAGVGFTVVSLVFVVLFVVGMGAVLFFKDESGKKDIVPVLGASVAAIGLVGAWAGAVLPNLIPATVADSCITIATAASSDTALLAMTIIAIIGVPLVLFYHVLVYRKFAGRVK